MQEDIVKTKTTKIPNGSFPPRMVQTKQIEHRGSSKEILAFGVPSTSTNCDHANLNGAETVDRFRLRKTTNAINVQISIARTISHPNLERSISLPGKIIESHRGKSSSHHPANQIDSRSIPFGKLR